MMSLSDDRQADIVDAFNTASRCLCCILDINNVCFDSVVSWICPPGLHFNKAYASDAKAAYLDLGLLV